MGWEPEKEIFFCAQESKTRIFYIDHGHSTWRDQECTSMVIRNNVMDDYIYICMYDTGYTGVIT